MAILDTGNSTLSSSFYLGKYYDPNRQAKKASNRKNMSGDSLIAYDSNAINKFVKDIYKIDYNAPQSNSESNLKNKVSAFVTIYNNFVGSTKKSSSSDTVFRADKIKKLTKSQEKSLNKMGISIKEDATLEIDKDKFEDVDIEKVKSLFSNGSDFMKQLKKISSKLDITV